jgi:hypothetical protein
MAVSLGNKRNIEGHFMVRREETNLRTVNVIYDPINNTFLVLLTKPICYHCYVKVT